MWQMFHDKLQSAVQLKKRNWPGSEFGVACGRLEDLNHIIFRCHLPKFVWTAIYEVLGWHQAPTSLEIFASDWMGDCYVMTGALMIFGLGIVC